jgi:cell pole-organizing protein PopZ
MAAIPPFEPEPEPVAEAPPAPAAAAPPAPDLVAPEAAAAAASSVGNLMRTLAAGRATQVWSGGPTLEDIVRAELRPMLKDWLDTNLPPLVERLVSAEIERVVNRAVP